MARIAIVGGGPSGSAFALHLIKEGVDPTDLVIFDQATFPRPKLCGGALTWRGTRALEELVGRPEGGSETRGLEFRSALGTFPITERGAQWLYDRAWLDAKLVERCVAAGVELREGCRVDDVAPRTEGWTVRTGGTKTDVDWVVGADGARGIVRRAAKLEGGIVGRLVEGVFEARDAEPDPSRLFFDFDPILDGIPGYAWIFPYPKPGAMGLFKIGVMDGRGVASGEHLRRFTLRFAERNGYRPVEPKLGGWPEHYFTRRARAHRPGLVLTGEALGIDPLLGEGIAPAIEISRYAARRVRAALDDGRRSIRGYERGLLFTHEGINLAFQEVLANRLYGRNGMRWLRVLFTNATMHRLAASGREAYGRLTHRAPRLIAGLAWQVLTRGLPSAEPIAGEAGG